jgi:hypothetical protein
MLRHQATLFCDCLVRGEDKRYTLAATFDNIRLSTLPGGKEHLGVFVKFVGENGDPWEVVFVGPDGVELQVGSGTVVVPHEMPPHAQWSIKVGVVLGFVTAVAGVARVVLRCGPTVVHEEPLGIIPPDERTSEEKAHD